MIQTNSILDAKGLACPMPIVKTKKAMNGLQPGEVLEVQATDKGSTADLKAWAESVGHQYVGTIEEENVLKHYLRKANENDEQTESKHPYVISNKELQQKMADNEDMLVLDVRESAEFAFNHILGAKSLPLGELEDGLSKLDKNVAIFVVCRTGSRSDLAAQKLAAAGFTQVFNVIPGMSEWNGSTEKTVK
ncbi:MAG: sulfurtransferase TusA family protein [Bacillus sp. (in: firmicutes)]